MICHYRLMNYNKCTTPVKFVDYGKDSDFMKKSLTFIQFCCQPQTALKTWNFNKINSGLGIGKFFEFRWMKKIMYMDKRK